MNASAAGDQERAGAPPRSGGGGSQRGSSDAASISAVCGSCVCNVGGAVRQRAPARARTRVEQPPGTPDAVGVRVRWLPLPCWLAHTVHARSTRAEVRPQARKGARRSARTRTGHDGAAVVLHDAPDGRLAGCGAAALQRAALMPA
jgi:hypothetical protein